MRVLLNLVFLMLWTGFVVGSIALAVYLTLRLVWAMKSRLHHPRAAQLAFRPWSRWEKTLVAFTVAGAAYWLAQWLTYTSHGSSFLFAASPALTFSVLAGINTIVSRRADHGPRTDDGGPNPGARPVQAPG